jgi:hypothetical protein
MEKASACNDYQSRNRARRGAFTKPKPQYKEISWLCDLLPGAAADTLKENKGSRDGRCFVEQLSD